MDIKAKIYEIEKDKTKADKLWRYIVMMIKGEESSFQIEHCITHMYDCDIESELNVSIEDIFDWVDDYLSVPGTEEKKPYKDDELKDWEEIEEEDYEDEEEIINIEADNDTLETHGDKIDLEDIDEDEKIEKKYQRIENLEFFEKKTYRDYVFEIYGEEDPDDSEHYSIGLGIADRRTNQYVYIIPKVLPKIINKFE